MRWADNSAPDDSTPQTPCHDPLPLQARQYRAHRGNKAGPKLPLYVITPVMSQTLVTRPCHFGDNGTRVSDMISWRLQCHGMTRSKEAANRRISNRRTAESRSEDGPSELLRFCGFLFHILRFAVA
jgi:hypothetical protein